MIAFGKAVALNFATGLAPTSQAGHPQSKLSLLGSCLDNPSEPFHTPCCPALGFRVWGGGGLRSLHYASSSSACVTWRAYFQEYDSGNLASRLLTIPKLESSPIWQALRHFMLKAHASITQETLFLFLFFTWPLRRSSLVGPRAMKTIRHRHTQNKSNCLEPSQSRHLWLSESALLTM